MKPEKQMKYRYFFLSFSLAFLTLALLYLVMMSMVHPKTPQELAVRAPVEEAVYAPERADALSMLVVGVSQDGLEADVFLLARFDPARESVPLVAFPPQTQVQTPTKTATLAEAYRYGGADFARQSLAYTLGITIDRYVRVDEAGLLVAAATVGAVEFRLPQEITLEQQGDVTMTLSPGVQLLDGPKIAAVIGYDAYEGGERARCDVIADLAAAVIDQRIDIALSTVADKVFEKLINLVESDLSYADYADRKPAAEYLAGLGREIAVPVRALGEFSDDQPAFILSDTFVALVTQTFS